MSVGAYVQCWMHDARLHIIRSRAAGGEWTARMRCPKGENCRRQRRRRLPPPMYDVRCTMYDVRGTMYDLRIRARCAGMRCPAGVRSRGATSRATAFEGSQSTEEMSLLTDIHVYTHQKS